jgi:hypothetical protein
MTIFLFFVITLILTTASSGDNTMQKFDKTKPYAVISAKGEIEFFMNDERIGDVRLGVFGLNWAYGNQSNAVIKSDSEPNNDVIRNIEGSLEIPSSDGKKLEFNEIISNAVEHGFDLYYKIQFPEAVKMNSYQVSFAISPNRLKGQKIILVGEDNQELLIPSEYGATQLTSKRVTEIRVAPESPEGFVIKIDKPIWVLVQDNRAFGSPDLELRLNLNEHGADEEIPSGTASEIRLKLQYNQPLFLIYNEDKQVHQNDTSNWIPFVMHWNDAPIDLSYMNEKPAGKHGFLKVDGEKFIFEDGTTAKFWGTCFSASANFPTHEQSEIIARRLAKFGVNIVRTHHADAGWSVPNIFEFDRVDIKDNTLSFDPESLDRYDYMIYCLKREGIYIYLDQLVHRKFKSGDGVDAVDQLEFAAKPYSNFDPRLIELQKKYSHDLWTHINPYTKLAYKDDPAIVLMEFANENDLFTQTVKLEPYRSRLEEKYRSWAKGKNIEVSSEPVDFTKFTEPILMFLHEVQREYYIEMTKYLRGIGVRVPMTGSNWSRNLALLSSLMVVDYADSHSYWDHPSNGKFSNRPMVASAQNVFASLSFNRLLGKPFFVSEWDQPWANEWRAEHTLAMSAVASYQGWNGLTVYTYRHSTATPIETLSGEFETFNDPARFGLFYHASLMFRRGDVATSKQTIGIECPEADIFKSPNPSAWNTPALTTTSEKSKLGMVLYDQGKPKDNLSLYPYNKPIIQDNATEIKSDDGQLYRNWEKRFGVIDTPFTKSAYGFIGEVGPVNMNGMDIKAKTPFATIAISSLTDEPISKSKRLLLTAVGRTENTGFKYNITHTKVLDRGNAPILIEPIEATIEFKTEVNGLKIWAIGADGQRIKEIQGIIDDGQLKFDIGKDGKTIYYLIEK